ncbi:MAG: NifB/NifX family molybdenum-iron cluster-binding protein [Candidatus Goldbacteria bacterium]|nr:NifB/NifX family molybdenum-iron cluster-binding protein [Candidatus Goldiibacteriota bacterium]
MGAVRVVAASTGNSKESEISGSFSGCPFFAVADISEGKVKSMVFVDIGSVKDKRAESAIGLGADILITGGIAAKDRNRFKEKNIKMAGFKGTVQEALNLYIKDSEKLLGEKIYGEMHNRGRCYSCRIKNTLNEEDK